MGVLRFNKRVEASVNSLGTFSKGECPPPHRYCSAKENMEKWYPIALVKLSELSRQEPKGVGEIADED
jgi:hypothetical protein